MKNDTIKNVIPITCASEDEATAKCIEQIRPKRLRPVSREPARAKPLPRRDPPPDQPQQLELFTGIAPHDLDEVTARALRLKLVAS